MDGFLSDTSSESNLSDTIISSSTVEGESSLFSQAELSTLEEDSTPRNIEVHVGYRPSSSPRHKRHSKPSNNITIRRDNRAVNALSLPIFSVYNMRSIWSKLNSLASDMDDRDTDISILSEVWEKKENARHQAKIEELFELKNTKYFSTARPGAKRGGGAAITARGNQFHVSKLNIEIPKPLEVVWGLMRPKVVFGGISKIVVCSFYSPPSSRKKSALIEHLSITINKLKVIHPNANFIIAGDKNDLNEKQITTISPAFRQIVLKPTRKNKTLTVVITDLHRYYQEPIIIPPVSVDEGSTGSPKNQEEHYYPSEKTNIFGAFWSKHS